MTDAVAAGRKGVRLGTLHRELVHFQRLRWVAAGVLVGSSYADLTHLHWYDRSADMLRVGVIVLVYNAASYVALRLLAADEGRRRRLLLPLAWVEITLDMGCLAMVTAWTGGVLSPVRGFFVFHMIFGALLLPPVMAYGSAGTAILMLLVSLWTYEALPATRDERLVLAGTVVMLVFVVYLTERVAGALRRQRRRLARRNKRIRHISRQLRRHRDALVQQEKMVAMGQMAAGVTHEIANPLASMDSLLQLIQRKPEKFKPETVTTLRDQIARITQIIQQMKTFASPAESQRVMAGVNEVVGQAVEMLRFDPRRKRVSLEVELSPAVGSAEIIPHALHQVLVNLIVNALDAVAEREGPRVVVRTEAREASYLIEVADNGCGIRPEHMRRLFEPFFTTKPVGKGTGLGLSISYKLMEKQGGRITVKSELGRGTTFTIRVPRPHGGGGGERRSQEREGREGAVTPGEKTAT